MPRTSPVLPFRGGLTNKPPAFQFYAKDWRSSMTVQAMTREQRSIYLDMMAIAWDSEEPGTITLSDDQLCHELRIFKGTLRRLLSAFPSCWRREEGKLVQPKLHEQWVKYKEIQQKRSASAKQMHMQTGGSAFASASAIASAPKIQTPALVPEENAFQTFWRAYPKKVNERQAFRAWVQCIGIHNHLEEILTVLMKYETSGMWDDPTKIPNAENFIRDKRWNDVVPQRSASVRRSEPSKSEEQRQRVKRAIKRVLGVDSQLGDHLHGELRQGSDGGNDPGVETRTLTVATKTPA